MEYTEGYQTIVHEDGSQTHISVEHIPFVEPLPIGKQLLYSAAILVIGVGSAAVPFAAAAWSERRAQRNELKARQKKNKEVFDQLKH